ncbi:hypothetical protein IC007_0590 [Sulfuracidifex tepidarius]|uniref:Uncharacterized protein n=1 Tax=Sulfuracidifex tepidarius TaxID=1294262 RepID=A0A510E0S0_9CREN|nr:hypothetical protein IC007_0590 [Sulfuracidifex tepidarius]
MRPTIIKMYVTLWQQGSYGTYVSLWRQWGYKLRGTTEI